MKTPESLYNDRIHDTMPEGRVTRGDFDVKIGIDLAQVSPRKRVAMGGDVGDGLPSPAKNPVRVTKEGRASRKEYAG